MRVAFDTNRYTDAAARDLEAVRVLDAAGEIYLPLIVIAELRAGFAMGSRQRENEAALQIFCQKPGVFVISPDDATTHIYATLQRQLRRQGTSIPIHDVWIAALVLQHGLILYTRDRHFDHLPQVLRL